MHVIDGHYDGQHVILDAPVPDGVAVNARVRIVFDSASVPSSPSSLGKIAELAVDGGLPTDFSEQHEHYVKGSPRR